MTHSKPVWRPNIGLPLEDSFFYLVFRSRNHLPELTRPDDPTLSVRQSPLFCERIDRGFFRSFAEMEPTRGGLLAFYERFGELILETPPVVFHLETGRLIHPIVIAANSPILRDNNRESRATVWHDNVLALRRCIRLWDLVCAGDVEQLQRHISWRIDSESGISVHYESHPGLSPSDSAPFPDMRMSAVIASQKFCPELLARMTRNDPEEPALSYIDQVVTQHLRDQVTVCMLPTFLPLQKGIPPKQKGSALYMVPLTFLVGIWLQFAQAVTGNKKQARCRQCNSWFEVTSVKNNRTRNDREYCSDRCKVNAYRQRKEEALRLHAEGKTARAIAKELGSDVDTVKGWLSKKEK